MDYMGSVSGSVRNRAMLQALAFMLAASFGIAISQNAAAQNVSSIQPQGAPKLFFEGDMVLAQACVLSNRFRRNEGVVWRVRVLDAKTGHQIDSKGLKSLIIELADGKLKELDAKKDREKRLKAVEASVKRIKSLSVLSTASEDEILGYNDKGFFD